MWTGFPYWMLSCSLMLSGAGAMAAVYPPSAVTPESDQGGPRTLALTNAPLRQISPGVYALGPVRLEKAANSLSFPGIVNMSEGLVEYALVHTSGKVHESVLRTDVDPLQIHLARLLLGAEEQAASTTNSATPRELRGPPIAIWVRWQIGDLEQRVRLEELVFNGLTKTRMTRGSWIYGGSRVIDGTLLAQRDGSIISVIADPDALVNNPRPGRHDDEIWTAHSALVPPVGTPVEITFELETTREQ
jgi:hypothetical protein